VHRVLPGLGDPVPFTVAHEAFAEGKTLRDLQLRSATGAVILAITRGEENVLLPVGGERLHAGDVLALAGTTDAIEEASRLMTHGPHVHDHENRVASGPM
jgi:CPA2 family monovalent cation:H+ antiporter-2